MVSLDMTVRYLRSMSNRVLHYHSAPKSYPSNKYLLGHGRHSEMLVNSKRDK